MASASPPETARKERKRFRPVRAIASFTWRRRWLCLLLLLLLLGGGTQWWAYHHYWAARQAVTAADFKAARRHVSNCLWIWPRSVSTNLLAARIERLDGDLETAEVYLKKCKRLNNGASTPETQLEWMLLQAHQDVDKVSDLLYRCIEEDNLDTSAILETLARVYIKQSRFQPAMVFLNLWVEREPNNPRALDWRSFVRLRTSQIELAADDCEAALKLDPTLFNVRLRLADILMDLRQYGDAEPHLKQLLEQQPRRPEPLLGLARCRMHANKYDEARQLLDRALDEEPDLLEALVTRAEVELNDDKPAEAEPWVRRALKESPQMVSGWDQLYRSLKRQKGRAREAEEALQRYSYLRAISDRYNTLVTTELDSKGHGSPQAATEAAELAFQLGHDKIGLHWLQLALTFNPRHLPAHRLAIAYYEKNNQAENAGVHRRAIANLAGGRELVALSPENLSLIASALGQAGGLPNLWQTRWTAEALLKVR